MGTSQHFIDLTERAAKAALAAGDEDTILLLEGFNGEEVDTVSFEEFPWSAEYLVWKAAKEAENEPEEEEAAEPELTLPENGGSGSYDSTGFLSFYGADSGQTFGLVSAGMVESGGTRFGLYVVPVDGELLRITGSGQGGIPTSELLIRTVAVAADGSLLQPVNTNCNVNMTNPRKAGSYSCSIRRRFRKACFSILPRSWRAAC